MKRPDEHHIGALFDDALRGLRISARVREEQVRGVFAEVVGEALAPICHAVRLQRGVLEVACEHTALAHSLQFEQLRICAELNARVGAGTVRRLRFTTPGAARDHMR